MQGIDYRAIGLALGHNEAVRIYERTVSRWQEHAEALERRLAWQRAEAEASDAGRTAQLAALERALIEVAPFDTSLARTGRVYDDGSPERTFEVEYKHAYDDVARRHGLPRCEGARTPEEWRDARAAAILAEPVVVTGWGWWQRVHFRGVEYRSVRGAERARAEAADEARESLP